MDMHPKVFSRKETERALHALSLLIAFNEGLKPEVARATNSTTPPDYEAIRLWACNVVLDYIKKSQSEAGY